MCLAKRFCYLIKIHPFLSGEDPWHNLEWDWWFKGIQGSGSRRFWKDVLSISETPGRGGLFHTLSSLNFWRKKEHLLQWFGFLPTCNQAALFAVLSLFKKWQHQKKMEGYSGQSITFCYLNTNRQLWDNNPQQVMLSLTSAATGFQQLLSFTFMLTSHLFISLISFYFSISQGKSL